MTTTHGLLSTITCDNCGHRWLAFGNAVNIRRQVEYIGGAADGDRHYCAGCALHLGLVHIMEGAMPYSPVALDPTPEPDVHVCRLYDVLADVVQPDGTLLARSGDVVNETVRDNVAAVVNGDVGRYLRPVDQDIPIDGSVDASALDADSGVMLAEWWEMWQQECQRFDGEEVWTR
jgi:hypothetical protein